MFSSMSNFLGELKRRKVLRAGLLYGAACFAVLEGADIVLSNLGMPSSVMRFLVVLAILGFPVALTLSWAYELTPDGLKRSGDGQIESTPWLSPSAGMFTVVLLALGGVAWWVSANLGEGSGDAAGVALPATEVPRESVAVLPFANLSTDPENEYFSDGLSEELLNVLSRVPGLKVAARTSSFSFKDKNADAREIGRSLAVANVLEGSVRKAEERVRITAQLVEAETGFQLWSSSFDRQLDDIFAVQDEIATAIVQALEMELVGGVENPVLQPVTTNQMAYDKYLWGRFNLAKRTEAGIYEAIENFNGSIMMDSAYAPAYAGLADAYLVLHNHSAEVAADPTEAFATSRAMAERAVELDPTLAEAHASLGGALAIQSMDWEGATAAFERAIALNPQYALAHQWLSVPLAILGRYVEAIAAARTAVSLDPLSVPANSQLGQLLYIVGRSRDAIEQFDRALALERDAPFNYELSALAYAQLGSWTEARDMAREFAIGFGFDPDPFTDLIE